jgi:hypothetical protein
MLSAGLMALGRVAHSRSLDTRSQSRLQSLVCGISVIRDRLGRDAGRLTSTSGQQSRVEPRLLFHIKRAANAPYRPKRATDFRPGRGHVLGHPRRTSRAGLSAHDRAGRRHTGRALHDGAPQKLWRHRMALQMTRRPLRGHRLTARNSPSPINLDPGLTSSALRVDRK